MPGLTRGVGSRHLVNTTKKNNKKNNKNNKKHFTMANLMKQIENAKKTQTAGKRRGGRKSRKAGRKSRSTRRR
jgi:hypothetical protein